MMRDCEDGAMRDLLPDYVNDTLSEAEHAKVEAHLRTCADCAAEVEVIEAAGRAYAVPTIDVDQIVKAIPYGSPQPRRFSRGFALAAGLGVLAFGAMRLYLKSPEATVAQAPVLTPAIVQPPKATIESSVVAAAPAPTHAPAASGAHRSASISFGGGLDDLSDEQLAALLSELDTLEALPSTEPETHLSPIVPDAGGGSNAR